ALVVHAGAVGARFYVLSCAGTTTLRADRLARSRPGCRLRDGILRLVDGTVGDERSLLGASANHTRAGAQSLVRRSGRLCRHRLLRRGVGRVHYLASRAFFRQYCPFVDSLRRSPFLPLGACCPNLERNAWSQLLFFFYRWRSRGPAETSILEGNYRH